ncbi:MAG: response regulator transcription factor [Bdellovibrionaceae bacterium]|nr:response regulator transcription factor [Pseudobdellovibrionaceae bacterium]
MKILLLEDEQNIYEPLMGILAGEGFEVKLAKTLSEARMVAGDFSAQAAILDWGLPDGQGIDFMKELRNQGFVGPIIMLTARSEVVDKVLGLELGANDYMTKPFEPRELVARIRSHLRHLSSGRSPSAKEKKLCFAGIELDPSERRVVFEGQDISLKKLEFDLLHLLMENPGKVFTRNELLNQVWGIDAFPTTRTVDNHILQLRQKIKDDLVETIRGVGYRLKKETKS